MSTPPTQIPAADLAPPGRRRGGPLGAEACGSKPACAGLDRRQRRSVSQAAWNGFASIILPHIGAGKNEMLVCGMSLGYADEKALVNTFRTPRVSAEEFTMWVD